MNRMNRTAGAMQCLAKSGASGVFYQQRITLITLILRAVRVICCSPLFIRFIWFIWWLSFLLCLLCLLLFFSTSDTTDLTDFSLSLSFPFPLPLSFSFSFSFLLVAHSGARTWCHALPWWALCCRYPHGPPAAANKNTLDYDDVPADGVEPPQGRAERGMG